MMISFTVILVYLHAYVAVFSLLYSEDLTATNGLYSYLFSVGHSSVIESKCSHKYEEKEIAIYKLSKTSGSF